LPLIINCNIILIMETSNFNLKLATEYFMGNDTLFNQKDEDYQNLFLSYATDNNSSTIRELSTMYFLKYKSFHNKLGADGIDENTGRLKEVKPRSVTKKLSGGSGNFNDMTLELLEKKKNMDVICSLFVDSRFVYIVEFPLEVIYDKLKEPIVNAKLGKRVVCSFSYKDYNDDRLKIHYLNKDLIHTSVVKNHANMLLERYDRKT
jgi:hypothetical protein